MKAGTKLVLTNPTQFDLRVGLRSGFKATVVEDNEQSNFVLVKFEDWKHPEHPLFDEGERMMLTKCFNHE